MECTPKQRMLNAYRGVFSDRAPVAPEFWYYVPAKVLGVDMIEFERIPHWQALLETFRHYGTEGWGIAGAGRQIPGVSGTSATEKLGDGRYRISYQTTYRGHTFTSARVQDRMEPSWTVEYPVKTPADLAAYLEMQLAEDAVPDFSAAVAAHATVGEEYLLELWMGVPFFDFVSGCMGFEAAILFFTGEDPDVLRRYQARYIEMQVEFVRRACAETPFESFFVGCSHSNNSLLGPRLWRQWDKPYLKAVADEVHRHGRLLHVHLHGKCLETVPDLAEIGLDCVCPFERPPGGDVVGYEGLHQVREMLAGKVTMNGNVHTVETLIRGTPEKVRAEVREILDAFAGEPRLIVGTGDQVGRETPEENIRAMVESVRREA